jgi:hypothetical protein
MKQITSTICLLLVIINLLSCSQFNSLKTPSQSSKALGVWQCASISEMNRSGISFSAQSSTQDIFESNHHYETRGEMIFKMNSRRYHYTLQGKGTWNIKNRLLTQHLSSLSITPKTPSLGASLISVVIKKELNLTEPKYITITHHSDSHLAGHLTLNHISEAPKVTINCTKSKS